jgi:uncharacterized membrane protein (DUF373 family)
MENSDKFSVIISTVKKTILRVLIGITTLALILGSVHLIYLVYQHLIEPPYFLIEVKTLFEIFNLILIIVIGYELIRSLLLIISSDTIPVIPITQIAIIAVANKIITLDIKNTETAVITGMAVLIFALGVAHFLLKYHKNSEK